MNPERKYPPFETRDRIKKWCDLQERAHSDVVKKLYTWGVWADEADQIVSELITNNYLNEERFARAFARGRFRIKRWGWKKIERELKQKSVSKYSIALAREEIDPEDYNETLKEVLAKKRPFIKGKSDWERNQKLLRYAVGRGYEYEEVLKLLED